MIYYYFFLSKNDFNLKQEDVKNPRDKARGISTKLKGGKMENII